MHRPDLVEVRSRYIGAWAAGFQIAEETASGYRVRRLADGALIPGEFSCDDVRHADEPERERVRAHLAACRAALWRSAGSRTTAC
jgi:hypothetical protein